MDVLVGSLQSEKYSYIMSEALEEYVLTSVEAAYEDL